MNYKLYLSKTTGAAEAVSAAGI